MLKKGTEHYLSARAWKKLSTFISRDCYWLDMFVFPQINLENGRFHRYDLVSSITPWMLKVTRQAECLNTGLLDLAMPLYN